MQIPGVCQSQGRFSHIFCNKLPSWWSSCTHSYFISYLVTSQVSDSSFIANNLRKKMSSRNYFHIYKIFTLIIGLHLGRHLGYIELLNDASMASLGFFKGKVCTTRINKEKKFKFKFQILLKFNQNSAGLFH